MSLFSIFIFIIILLALVIVHEAGHFFAAKALGVRVDEFAFGFPPKLFSKKFGETEYVFNSLPLGGYVKIHGEEGGEVTHDKRSLASKPWWAQLIVLLAGVTMNIVFAFVLLVIISFGTVTVGEDDTLFARASEKKLIVTDVLEGSPAAKAGLTGGDEILSLSTKGSPIMPETTADAISFIQKADEPVTITYQDEKGTNNTITIAPVYGIVKDKKAIGVGLMSEGVVKLNLFDALKQGAHELVYRTKLVVFGVGNLFSELFKGHSVMNQLVGPVGIIKEVHKAELIGFDIVLSLAAMLSINLAVLNILPFPALDGGRAVIVLGETIARRKMNKKFFANLNAFGFIFLMIVSVVVIIKDFIH